MQGKPRVISERVCSVKHVPSIWHTEVPMELLIFYFVCRYLRLILNLNTCWEIMRVFIFIFTITVNTAHFASHAVTQCDFNYMKVFLCMSVCVRACVRVCMCARVHACMCLQNGCRVCFSIQGACLTFWFEWVSKHTGLSASNVTTNSELLPSMCKGLCRPTTGSFLPLELIHSSFL